MAEEFKFLEEEFIKEFLNKFPNNNNNEQKILKYALIIGIDFLINKLKFSYNVIETLDFLTSN